MSVGNSNPHPPLVVSCRPFNFHEEMGMKLGREVVVFLAALLLTGAVAAAQTYQQEVEESNLQFRESMEGMANFVKGVTFDEEDIKSIITYREELESLGGGGVREGFEDEEDDEEMIDFNKILADDEYRSWAKSKGLDPDTWMKKFMRVQLLMMKDEIAATASEGSARMEAQLAELEAQRARMGEELYKQMKEAMEIGAASMSSAGAAFKNLPEPTPSEKELIERYRDQFVDF
jgi:hypothetical protein